MSLDFAEIIACVPRMPGDWRNLSAMMSFIILAWAFRATPRQHAKAVRRRAR